MWKTSCPSRVYYTPPDCVCFCLLFSLNCDEKKFIFGLYFFNDFVTSSSIPLIRLRASRGKIELMSLLFNCVPFYNFFFFSFRQELPYHDTTRKQAQVKICTYLFFIVIEHFVAKFSNSSFWYLIFTLESTKWKKKNVKQHPLNDNWRNFACQFCFDEIKNENVLIHVHRSSWLNLTHWIS